MRKRHWISFGLYFAVGLVFAYAGYNKVLDTETFVSSLLTYELFPHRVASLLAQYLPWLEVLIGLCLISGILRKGGEVLAWLLLAAFFVSIGQAWIRGLSIDCGCFGEAKISSKASDYLLLIGRDFAMAAGLWFARVFSRARNVVK